MTDKLDALYKFNVATEEEAKRNLIPPPPPTQGEEERAQALAKELFGLHYASRWPIISTALRQRADEATRAENEACAVTVETYYAGDIAKEIAKSIRARITP